MTEDRTDKRLIRAIAAGNRDALAELYDRYAGDLMAVGMKYLADESRAEALIHEVYLEVWESAHEYDPDRGSVRTWLTVRMRSRTLDKVRYEDRRDHDQLADVARREGMTADEDPARDAEYEWIRRAVGGLPSRLRKVLVCTYYHEMTGPEIADELDIPVGTVRSRLAKAREELRSRVQSGAGDDDE